MSYAAFLRAFSLYPPSKVRKSLNFLWFCDIISILTYLRNFFLCKHGEKCFTLAYCPVEIN